MKTLPFLLVIFTILVFSNCTTSHQSNNSNTVVKKRKKDRGEVEFDNYLERKKGKFKNKPAPSQSITTIDGKTYRLDQMKGKIVLLNFWFTACKPCMTEVSSLNELRRKYESKGLIILAVSTDSKSKAVATAKEKKMNYKIASDGKSFADKMEVTSYPTTFLIDQKGIIREVFIGASSFDATQTYTEIKPHIEKLLQK